MENDVSVEIRKQRGFPQATRLRRISHRPDGGNASQSTYFWAAAIHLKAGDFLSKEWGDPPCEAAYEILLKGLLEEAKGFPGFEGGQVLRPQGADGLEYQVTLHFENRQAEERWMSFEGRHRWIDAMKALEDTSATTMLTGLEAWFTLPAENHRKVAPKHKATFVVWTAVFPTVLAVSALLSQLPFQMPLFLSVFVITAISVPVAVYILLPRLCRLLDPWVYRESKATGDRANQDSSATDQEETQVSS